MTRVILFHQHDPGINFVGGIGTFINTFIKHAPADFEVSVVGVTADPETRPVGRWQRVSIGGRSCEFLPVVSAHPSRRGRVPISVLYSAALWRSRKLIDLRDAVLDFHRIEPIVPMRRAPNPKVLVLHAHMMDLYNPLCEVFWRRAPRLYFAIERALIHRMDRVYIVREDGVEWYRKHYPKLADRIEFLPTWVDEDVFVSEPEHVRAEQRAKLGAEHGFAPSDRVLLFVGRFEGQKDPLMLLESFRRLNGLRAASRLVLIGEGSMEAEMRRFIQEHQLGSQILILGPQPQTEIARWMNVADCLCLSSAFEGMPRVVVEALGCGLPVVTTAVGEAPRLVQDGGAGRLVTERTPEAFASAVGDLLRHAPDRAACHRQIESFTAKKILERVYGAYRELAQRGRR